MICEQRLVAGLSRPRSAELLRAVMTAVSAALILAAPVDATSPSSGRTMFSLSALRATAMPGQAATRYSVTVAHVPADDAPTFTWYLHVTGPGVACSDAVLAGGRRLSTAEYVWVNQRSSFVWYTGAAGSYPTDRSYGCDQGDLGRGGYPGTVTLVVENEYQHCSASFAGVAPGAGPRWGPPASCALGGYSLGASTLPV